MSSTFGGFETAKSGLSVAMQQLNVTEQNITNVNTAGYTRQRLTTSAREPASSEYLIAQLDNALIGQGVEVTGVQQIRSAYLDQQFRNLNSNYNYSANRDQALTYMDGLFNEFDEDSGLTTSIENYFSALKDFATNTSSKEFRTNVQQQALSMTETFNAVSEEMTSLWQDQNSNIDTVTQRINAISQKIGELNDAIAKSMQLGGSANDLNDERNLLLDELSGYVNITYDENTVNKNMVDVKIGGVTLVEGRSFNTIGVGSVSDLASQIAQINADIASTSVTPAAGLAAINDLVDQMELYNPTAAIIGTVNTTTNQIDITYNGVALVTGTTVASTDLNGAIADGDLDTWIALNRNNLTLDGSALGIGSGITSGQLYSSMEMTTSSSDLNPGIPYYMAQMNQLARNIAQNMNAIHQQGYTYPNGSIDYGAVDDSDNDYIFFDAPSLGTITGGYTDYDYTKVNAGNFTISDAVLESVYNIAGASNPVTLTTNPDETGNNEIATALLQDLEKSGYYEELNSIVGHLAITSKTTSSIMETKKSLLSSADAQRTSLSGVSLDEETTNLIIFQQSYNAAAKIISTLDEMLNTLINTMGN